MPSSRAALQITDRYRAALLRQRDDTVRQIGRVWLAGIDPDDFEASIRRLIRPTARSIADAQAQAVRMSDAYLAAYAGAELGRNVPPAGIDPAEYSGRTADGRPLPEILRPAMYSAFIALGAGRGPREAATASLARVVRASRTEIVEAARASLADLMDRSNVIRGWRRVTSADPCGACLALADGTVHDADELPEMHGHCRCTAEPVVRGVRDTVQRPTGEQMWEQLTEQQQNRLFAGRGGADKAELIRSGHVHLNDLVSRERHLKWRPTITETPMAALT